MQIVGAWICGAARVAPPLATQHRAGTVPFLARYIYVHSYLQKSVHCVQYLGGKASFFGVDGYHEVA
jgi:hypothetical protein